MLRSQPGRTISFLPTHHPDREQAVFADRAKHTRLVPLEALLDPRSRLDRTFYLPTNYLVDTPDASASTAQETSEVVVTDWQVHTRPSAHLYATIDGSKLGKAIWKPSEEYFFRVSQHSLWKVW